MVMHVSLYVSRLEASLDFYTRFFGTPPAKVAPAYAKWELPQLVISFIENPERIQPAFGHLGFRVDSPEALERQLAAAQAAGLPIRQEQGTRCCYALQDKFWVEDPDGVQWEVYYFHADSQFNDPRYEAEAASACCMPPAAKPKRNLSQLSAR
ncbi:MAG: VOC family protein [Bacteroidetes bacterium]|jgi:catechol 2,3-dioxygenase-like lactoylglutathione lyase family enzyme|nr:VOC family protein [Bacteroidota bacterium]